MGTMTDQALLHPSQRHNNEQKGSPKGAQHRDTSALLQLGALSSVELVGDIAYLVVGTPARVCSGLTKVA